MKKLINNNKGFTVIEAVIALAILAVIFSLIGPLFVTGINFFEESNSRVIDQANLRRAMVALSREMRDANTVNVVDSTKVEIDSNTYYYNSVNNVILKAPTSGGNAVVISEFVTFFEVTIDGNLVSIKAQGTNASSMNEIDVYIRSQPVPTPTP